jgi:hypothetical protein
MDGAAVRRTVGRAGGGIVVPVPVEQHTSEEEQRGPDDNHDHLPLRETEGAHARGNDKAPEGHDRGQVSDARSDASGAEHGVGVSEAWCRKRPAESDQPLREVTEHQQDLDPGQPAWMTRGVAGIGTGGNLVASALAGLPYTLASPAVAFGYVAACMALALAGLTWAARSTAQPPPPRSPHTD